MRGLARLLSRIARSIFYFVTALGTWVVFLTALVAVVGAVAVSRREPPIYVVEAARDLPAYSILTADDIKLVLVVAPPATAITDKTGAIGDATAAPIGHDAILTTDTVVNLPPEAAGWTTVSVAQSPTPPLGLGVPATILGFEGNGQNVATISQRAVTIASLPGGVVVALPPEEALLLDTYLSSNGHVFVERRPTGPNP